MNKEDELRGKLALLGSGASRWIETAEEEGVDEEAVEHVEQAHEHVREAIEILEGE